MTITAPIFKWASWGKSDDIFVGIPDSFQDSQNIDIRTNPRGIKLNKALVKDSLTVVVEPINCFIKVSTGDILAFGNSWGVYHKTGGVWYKNTNSITGAILSAIKFNGTIYRASGFELTSIKENNRLIRFKDWFLTHWLNLCHRGSPLISIKYNPENLTENQLYKRWDFEYISWFMLRYIIHLKPNLQRNYEVLPYSKIEEMGAKMYKWIKQEV